MTRQQILDELQANAAANIILTMPGPVEHQVNHEVDDQLTVVDHHDYLRRVAS